MSLIKKTNSLNTRLKNIAMFLKYGTREQVVLCIAVGFIVLAGYVRVYGLKGIPRLEEWQDFIFLGCRGISVLCVVYVGYRYWRKIASVRPIDETALPMSIKGLMAFIETEEDSALFVKLGRDTELSELKGYIENTQVPLITVMGHSGAGKTSLLRAGVSHLLKSAEAKYIYWEALPHDASNGLRKAISKGLDVEIHRLNEILKLPNKAVIVLDQFEQLLPDKSEFSQIFNLLKQVMLSPPPHNITWIIAFRREYAANWRDFEVDNELQPPNTISLKLFSLAQAQNVLVTLAQEAGFTLEQALVDSFIKTVQKENHVSPVEIGIGLLMLQDLASTRQMRQVNLADYHFAGGSQGLFVSFLKNKIEQRFPGQFEQEALFKVLLEFIDLSRDQRLAEGKTLSELEPKAEGLHLEFALNYLASAQVRLLEKTSRLENTVPVEAYRLQHESMIPALRQLGNSVLDEISQANLTLQMAYTAWQNSAKKTHFLLTGKDLKTVLKFREQLDLKDKESFIKQSLKKSNAIRAYIIGATLMLSVFSCWSYNYFLEWRYQENLRNWGMPEDLRDYRQQIKKLSVNDNEIKNLDWLAAFTQLRELDLTISQVSDISALKELKNLSSLTFRRDTAIDMVLLSDMSKLEKLDLKFKSLPSLKGLPSTVTELGLTK